MMDLVNLDAVPLFAGHKTTLMQASMDDSDREHIEYMTQSDLEAVDFDLVKRLYTKELKLSEESATSVDAIVQFKDHIDFIEFKNGKVNNRNIKDKARDSLLIFLDLTGKNISYAREQVDYIVVYNIEKNPLPNQMKKGALQDSPSRISIANHFSAKAETPLILFDLEKYQTLYFRKVRTYSKEEFEKYLQAQ